MQTRCNKCSKLKYENVTIMSFNTLAPIWIDEQLRKEVNATYLEKNYRIDKHIKVIKKYNPDILFLQESTPSILNKYQEQLPEYYLPPCFAQMKWAPFKEEHAVNGNAIMWKPYIFKNDYKCSVVMLDSKRGNYASVVNGTFYDNKPITLVCIHLECGNYDVASKQFRNIVKKNIIDTKNNRTIIAGDFNMGDKDLSKYPIIPDIKKWNLKDPLNGFRTHPFMNEECEGISHILHRGFKKIKSKQIGNAKSIEDCLKKYGSDHYPVSIKLVL